MQPPSDPPRPAGQWVPFAQAMQALGETETTLRRMIREGRVQAEKRRRNPDSATDFREVYEVFIPDSPTDPPPSADDHESGHPPVIRQEPPDIASALLERNTVQADRIAALERENGRLESDAKHAAELARIERERRVAAEALANERGRELERLRRPWWRRLLDS